MKEIKNVENVYMDVNEFLNVKTIRENRCAIDNLDEARADFYSEAQHKEFISRTKGYLKMFRESKGWSRFCPATVFEYNGEYFIGDGQGRRAALKLLNRSRSDVRIALVPVTIHHMKKYEDMVDAIVALNSRNKNWKKLDMVRADAIKSGKTEFLELVNKISAELGCTSSIATYILIGTKATHRDQKGYTPYMYYEYIVKALKECQKMYPDTKRFRNDAHIRTFVPFFKLVCEFASREASDISINLNIAVNIIKSYFETKSENALDMFFKGHFTTVKANFVDHFNGVRGDDRKSPFGKNKILLEAFKQYKLNVGMR